MTSSADKHRARVRALLAKHDPALLEFMDAARGVFGQGVRATQLELTLADGRKLDLRNPIPDLLEGEGAA